MTDNHVKPKRPEKLYVTLTANIPFSSVESQSTKLKERFESVGYRVMNLLQVCLGAALRQARQKYWGFVQWEGRCLTNS